MSEERRDGRSGDGGGRAADTAPRVEWRREPAARAGAGTGPSPESDERQAEAPRTAELAPPPAVAQVREEDLEPHAGLRYIAALFKGLAVLIALMLIAEVAIGLQQDGTAAIGLLLLQATRLVVIAAFLWGAGDIALMLIESNHDLRASRILLGRVHAKLETLVAGGAPTNATQAPPAPRADAEDAP